MMSQPGLDFLLRALRILRHDGGGQEIQLIESECLEVVRLKAQRLFFLVRRIIMIFLVDVS